MVIKKFYFTIFALLSVFFILQSCEKKTENKPEKKSNLVEINRLIALGEKHFKNTKYDSSYYYFNKAKSLCDVKKDTAKIIYSILNLAAIEQNQGDYSSSETTILEAFPFLKNNPKPNHHWGVYTTLGLNYLNTFDYKLAFYYNNLALSLKTDYYRRAGIKNNIALTHMEIHDYRKAIQILLPLTLQKQVINDVKLFPIILDNLGYCYFKEGNSKAFEIMNQSLKIRIQEKNDCGLVESYIHLSEYYQKRNQKLAYKYAQLAYEKATKVNNVDDRLESLK